MVIVRTLPIIIQWNTAENSCSAVERFCGSFEHTGDDQGGSTTDERDREKWIEWGLVLLDLYGTCSAKTKDRGEGQGHEEREYETTVDEELFERSAHNE